MKITLMASVTVLTLCGVTNFAFAQGAPAPRGEPAAPPASAPSAPQSSPGSAAPKSGPTAPDKASPSAAPTQAQEKSDPKTAPRAQDKADTKSPDTKAPATKAGDSKGESKPAATKSGDTKPAADSKSGDTKPAAADSKSGDKPTSADTKAGSAASAPAAAPPAEKRTQITSAIKQERVTEVTNVNFNVSIGTRVPSTVTYHPLPSRVIEIYPEWRGYYFILVKGRYVILRPQTYEIVYIIEG